MVNLYQISHILTHPDQKTRLGELFLTAYLVEPSILSIIEADVVLSPTLGDTATEEIKRSGLSSEQLRVPRTATMNLQAVYESISFQQVKLAIQACIDYYHNQAVLEALPVIETILWVNRETHNIPRYRKRLLAIFKQLGFKKVDGTDDQWVWEKPREPLINTMSRETKIKLLQGGNQ